MVLVARRVLNAGRGREPLALSIYNTGKLVIQQDADVIEIDGEYVEDLSNLVQTLLQILKPTGTAVATVPAVWRTK